MLSREKYTKLYPYVEYELCKNIKVDGENSFNNLWINNAAPTFNPCEHSIDQKAVEIS